MFSIYRKEQQLLWGAPYTVNVNEMEVYYWLFVFIGQ